MLHLSLRVPDVLEMPLRNAAIQERQQRGGGRVSMSALVVRILSDALMREKAGGKK